MHQLIASPYNGTFLIAHPGSKGGMRIPRTLHAQHGAARWSCAD
ncbi:MULTISPECIES: hypothetical protein [unclassified Streptomyces]|nr:MULTISPECIES: hypothetical protein [unclassified Streptomyces]